VVITVTFDAPTMCARPARDDPTMIKVIKRPMIFEDFLFIFNTLLCF
jgi:hypothetical protein